MDDRFDLSDTAIELFAHEDFFEMVLAQNYDVSSYAKALAHICQGNLKLSKDICQWARECCYDGSRANYLKILNHVLKLNDTDHETGELLKPKRLEWVFGTAQPVYTQDDQGQIKVGLQSLKFNINEEAHQYVTAIHDNDEDKKTVLKLLVKSYCVEQLAADQAEAEYKESTGNKKSKDDDSAVQKSSGGIVQSTILDQLRVSLSKNIVEYDMVMHYYICVGTRTARRVGKSDGLVARC